MTLKQMTLLDFKLFKLKVTFHYGIVDCMKFDIFWTKQAVRKKEIPPLQWVPKGVVQLYTGC